MSSIQDDELQSYFTDMEYLRDTFKDRVVSETLSKRLLIIHGIGGVGKSSLLKMFRFQCEELHIPSALVSDNEDLKSAIDVLSIWTDDLKDDGVVLSLFRKTFEQYQMILAKVSNQAKKTETLQGKAVLKTIERTGSAVGALVGSIIPGIGTIVGGVVGGVIGGMSAEAFVDWLHGFLGKSEIDLLLDPTKRLTDQFLADITKVAVKKRMVLMIDTFEQMTALNDWVRDTTQRLHPNVLLVIAGRALPNWDRKWREWMVQAQIEEIKPMSENVMRELVHRYHAAMPMVSGRKPNPEQVDEIIRFAHGLPLMGTGTVDLWVKYPFENFEAIKPEIIANLVDRLMEGVPRELVPALEAAAIVRWFDQPILRAVTQHTDVRDAYNELRRFPFVRTRTEGLALHDALREIIDANLRVQDSERHREFHERAAEYFEKRLETTSSEDVERLGLERLYHRVSADEETGLKLFQGTVEWFAQNQLVNSFRLFISDINTYRLEREGSKLWREYYNARQAQFENRIKDAEQIYWEIQQNEHAEAKLRAYALCDLGGIWTRSERLSQTDGEKKVFDFIYQALQVTPQLDSKLIYAYSHLRNAYIAKGKWEHALETLERQQSFFQETGDMYGTLAVISSMKSLYGLIGDWKKAFSAVGQGSKLLELIPGNRYGKIRLLANQPWVHIWSGHYTEAEVALREALDFHEQAGNVEEQANLSKDLGLATGLQGKYQQARDFFLKARRRYERFGSDFTGGLASTLGFWGHIFVRGGNLESAMTALNLSLSIKRQNQDALGRPELLNWLGEAYEIQAQQIRGTKGSLDLTPAALLYWECLNDYRWTGRRYFESYALTSLTRVKYAQSDFDTLLSLLSEAEPLAHQFEYHDHLASLHLIKGHVIWEGSVPELREGFDTALINYQYSLIYALRFNRFLLDEVLSGRPQGTPLHPIIPHCLRHNEEGIQMLATLRDWWNRGINEIDNSHPDTISPIPQGIKLSEAEGIARKRELGDGSPQKTLLEQIDMALAGNTR